MREIKFRAWDNKAKVWLLGYEYPNLGGFSMYGETILLGEYSSTIDRFLFSRDGHKPEDFVLMQYTGLTDKNGKEIYEGDIVKHNYESVGEVVYWTAVARYIVQFNDDLDSWDSFDMYDMGYSVIGNIYENPELLEK